MSGDSFLYYHFQSEAPSVTIPGCMRDILGRTAAHQWLDGVRPCQWSESCLDQFKDVINFKMQDLDDQDFLGRTLLHIACEQRWYRGVVWLLDQGVNPGIVTGYGSLPLHYAAAYGSSFICELLFFYQLKFDIHAKDNAQLSALDYATAFNYGMSSSSFQESLSEKVTELLPTKQRRQTRLFGRIITNLMRS
jgi:ankyrin repeat protein